MTVHIVKLCVGVDAIDDLARWQRERLRSTKRETGKGFIFYTTRMVPRRQDDVLDGGSIYWVIRGVIQVRQRITAFEEGQRADGTKVCLLILDPELVPVRPTPRRAFQGWRYLEPDDAPKDLDSSETGDYADMPPKMRRELAELCLL
ncbi:MAG: DUF1489 family protein [Hyphomicrobiaceae bacterium TMED74]|nr:hypothetical protein [Filomicrobium sp.]RPG45026.1 MAG: DUF1489 family protein [Hyphomicrobiaceae bacterium TMED74]